MARSSKPRRPRDRARPYRLTLTRGGGAELLDLEEDETVWTSDEDDDFREEFPDFLHYDDVMDILEYLEDIQQLTELEADHCQIEEQFIDAADLAGMVRKS